jgi:hypothetical protein
MPKGRISKKVRSFVTARAKHRCEYCQCRSDVALESFEVEHIIPQALEGANDLDNLALSCRGCNSRKATRIKALDPASQKKIPIFNPREDKWKDHFAWDEDYIMLKGLTPTGRATIEALQLNRPGVKNLRVLMKLGNIHPPIDTL